MKRRALSCRPSVGRVGDDIVQVTGDRADILGNGPFVVVQHDDEALAFVTSRC